MKAQRLIVVAALALAPAAFAQDSFEAPKLTPEQQKMMETWEAAGRVGAEHQVLKTAFEGNWDAKTTMWWDPATPPETGTAKATSASIYDGRFQRETFNGTWQGKPFEGTAVTGYDNIRKKYLVNWIDSVSTAMYVGWGDYDAAKKTFTFHGEASDAMDPGKPIKIRQIVTIDGPDQHTMTWYETKGGKPEAKTMQIVYTRRK